MAPMKKERERGFDRHPLTVICGNAQNTFQTQAKTHYVGVKAIEMRRNKHFNIACGDLGVGKCIFFKKAAICHPV